MPWLNAFINLKLKKELPLIININFAKLFIVIIFEPDE